MPGFILKVVILTIHPSPVPFHWYDHRNPVLTRELRDKDFLQSSILRSKGPPHCTGHMCHLNPLGWYRGYPSSDPRGDACY